MMTKTAYIGIGSNLGDKLGNCRSAVDRIRRLPGCEVTAQSGFYRTAPVGVKGQDWYVNGVVAVSTANPARHLLKSLLAIETEMGRERRRKWDARIIDLDILLFGDEVIDEEDLTVPHPMMHMRKFVLVPMVSMSPEVIHPVLEKPMAALLSGISDESQTVVRLESD
jgi:2-amino-4-hydroxy-6-hydroxymethyldihydropteridine diphosphokinase